MLEQVIGKRKAKSLQEHREAALEAQFELGSNAGLCGLRHFQLPRQQRLGKITPDHKMRITGPLIATESI